MNKIQNELKTKLCVCVFVCEMKCIQFRCASDDDSKSITFSRSYRLAIGMLPCTHIPMHMGRQRFAKEKDFEPDKKKALAANKSLLANREFLFRINYAKKKT